MKAMPWRSGFSSLQCCESLSISFIYIYIITLIPIRPEGFFFLFFFKINEVVSTHLIRNNNTEYKKNIAIKITAIITH